MKKWRQASRPGLVVLAWMSLAWSAGCSRQLAVSGSTGATTNGQLPFDRASDNSGVSPTADLASDGVPAGTEIAVRLRGTLSSADARVGDSFEATLDDPVIVAGKTVVQRGAPVAGSVVDTRGSAGRDPGYMRMTLVSIAMNGSAVALQTSSIFAKGGSLKNRTAAFGTGLSYLPNPSDVRFSTGHRFTFRLLQPLHLQD